MLRAAIIGAGAVSRAHSGAYQLARTTGLASVDAVVDPDLAAAESLAGLVGAARTERDYRRALEDKSIDVVDICLPPYLHCTVTLDALNAGKHVILEKPIAITLEEADRMLECAKRTGKRFFVMLNQRFMPCHSRAKQLLESGGIGRPFLAIATCIGDELGRMNDPSSWKGTSKYAGGGILADTGTHFVDLLQYFFGVPTVVSATTKRLVVRERNKAEDTCVVTFEYPGLIAEFTGTYAASANSWEETKDIYGEEGSLHINNASPNSSLSITRKKGRPLPVDVESWGSDWWRLSVERGVLHFLNCIEADTEPVVYPEDARRCLQTILAAYESAKLGRPLALC